MKWTTILLGIIGAACTTLLIAAGPADEKAAWDPPPISLHVQNATNEQVAAALSTALGVPVRIGQVSRDTFTLDATDQSYWEIFRALSLQHPIRFRAAYWDYETQQRIFARGDDAKSVRKGGIALVAAVDSYKKPAINWRGGPPEPVPANMRRLELLCQVIFDPRVKALEAAGPQIASVVDDLGSNLYAAPVKPKWEMTRSEETDLWQVVKLLVPKDSKAKSVTIKGELAVLVQVSEYKREVDNIDAHIGQPYDVGPQVITLQRYDVVPYNQVGAAPGRYDVNIDIDAETAPAAKLSSSRVHYVFFDANGADMTFAHPGRLSVGVSAPKPVPPIKLVVSVPNQTTLVKMPFELPGVMLPQ